MAPVSAVLENMGVTFTNCGTRGIVEGLKVGLIHILWPALSSMLHHLEAKHERAVTDFEWWLVQ
jgi:hypothetical protein